MDSCAWDALAGPLRELDLVLRAVRESRFHPDATRSGTFSRTPASTSTEQKDTEIKEKGNDVEAEDPYSTSTSDDSDNQENADHISEDSDAIAETEVGGA